MSAIAVDQSAQKAEALALANQVRSVRKADKIRLKRGLVSVDLLLEQPEWATATVVSLLALQHNWGTTRATRLAAKVPVSQFKRCGDLTARQRATIAELLEGTA